MVSFKKTFNYYYYYLHYNLPLLSSVNHGGSVRYDIVRQEEENWS